MGLLVGLTPFHAFLITWAGAPVVLSMWREFLVMAICGLIAVEIVLEKRWPRFDALDWVIIAFAAVAIFWLPFQRFEVAQWALGVRFDVMPFVFLLFLRQAKWDSEKMTAWLYRIFFITAGVVVLFGIFHATSLPKDFLTHFGYPAYNTVPDAENGLTACQYLEHTTSVCRATSTFGGPTRYGVFLLLVLGMLLPAILQKTRERGRGVAVALFAMTLASVFLTYSRSIWIGLATAAIFALFWAAYIKVQYRKKIIIAGLVVLVLLIISAGIFAWRFSVEEKNSYVPQLAHSIFVRTASSNKHVELAKKGLQTIIAHPLGMGLGKVGPASVRFNEKFLTENWYLQIGAEMGVLGLLLFCGLLVVLSKKLLADKTDWRRIGLFLSLFGIAITGLFTHSFEETSAVLVLMAFMGVNLSYQVRN